NRRRLLRSTPAQNANALGSDSLRRNRDPAGRANVRVWGAERARQGPCCDGHSHRHGGDASDRNQLRADGTSVSERGIGVHLCGAGGQSSGGLLTGWSMVMDYMLNPLICTVWCAGAAHQFAPGVPAWTWKVFFALL